MLNLLTGIRIVDLTGFAPGAGSGLHAMQLLGDLGADAIRVVPLSKDAAPARNLRTVLLDPDDAAGRDALERLVETAHVALCGEGDPASARLAAINPMLVHCTLRQPRPATPGFSRRAPAEGSHIALAVAAALASPDHARGKAIHLTVSAYEDPRIEVAGAPVRADRVAADDDMTAVLREAGLSDWEIAALSHDTPPTRYERAANG